MIRLFATGLFISFLGTLPLGTLNITAMQLSLSEGIGPAMWFSLGALLVETGYVRLSLVAMGWVRAHKSLFRSLEWLSVVFILALAAGSFVAASHPAAGSNPVLNSPLPRFLLGVTMSAVNPLQIPFWFGWSAILFQRKILQTGEAYYMVYLAGIGLGTFAGNSAFIFGGRYLADTLSARQGLMNGLIGGIFLLTALLQLWKLLRHNKNAAEKL